MCRLWWTSLLAMIKRNGSMVSPDVQTFCLFRWIQWASPRHVAVCLFPLHANYTSCINVTVYYLERRYFIGLVNPFVSVENFSSCRNFSVILVAVGNQAHSMDKRYADALHMRDTKCLTPLSAPDTVCLCGQEKWPEWRYHSHQAVYLCMFAAVHVNTHTSGSAWKVTGPPGNLLLVSPSSARQTCITYAPCYCTPLGWWS